MERYTGIYRDEIYGPVKIARVGDHLELSMGKAIKTKLSSWDGDTFSHLKSVMYKPQKPDPKLLYPPYTSLKDKIVRTAM